MHQKKLKFILKFFINSDSTSLDSKISTVLGQCRVNSSDFFNFFTNKVKTLNINTNVKIKLKVFLIVFDLDDFLVYIKMPSFSHLINHFFTTCKNFTHPGFFYKNETRK